MILTDEEKAMLAGELGPGVQKAMEIVSALGTIYGAEDLAPVSSVQVAGVSYKNLGEAGLEFLAEWAAQGARVRVPTMLNPAGLDLEQWQALGFDPDFARRQAAVIEAFTAMGITPTCTCTPYLVGNVPSPGEHLAWAESSAISFANSVLGARSNREGGPSALAAAISGRTARYGLHLEPERRAQLVVDVRCPVRSEADFGALGTIVGKLAGNRVPYFHGLDLSPLTAETDVAGLLRRAAGNFPLSASCQLPSPLPQEGKGGITADGELLAAVDRLKLLGAAMAASGAVALYHVEGVTPESGRPDIIAAEAETVTIGSLEPGYAGLNSDDEQAIDLVWIGCPHASLIELERVVTLLAGRQVQAALWVTVARPTREEAEGRGLLQALEASGGQLVADTCLVVAPVQSLGFRRMATPSGKGAYYVPSHSGLGVRYGSLEQCIEAAITGWWPDDQFDG